MQHRVTGIVRQLVLNALMEQAMTSDELQRLLGRGKASVNGAIFSLKAENVVADSGVCRLAESGKPVVVWRAVNGPAPEAWNETMGVMPQLRWRCK